MTLPKFFDFELPRSKKPCLVVRGRAVYHHRQVDRQPVGLVVRIVDDVSNGRLPEGERSPRDYFFSQSSIMLLSDDPQEKEIRQVAEEVFGLMKH
ncbi:MAG: hypothetical protein WDZ85_04010 [Candidatus Paceibacterota bacterium]